ncbi:MAG: ABC transporter permease [Acidimicrobiia bacterium]|nr:ABC transporter permease [Acidimicrobiia bacterium]
MTSAVPTRGASLALRSSDRTRSAATIIAGAAAIYAVQLVMFPTPTGQLLKGVIVGGLTALIAIGIALVYRANRIINFAQADLGVVPTAFTIILITGPGIPLLLALPIGIAGAIVVGALLEFLIIRRFTNAPRLILTVATIGMAQALAGLGLVIPRLLNNYWPGVFALEDINARLPQPFDLKFSIGSTTFHAFDVVAIVAIVASVASLAAFFRYTRIGIAVRASAESADRAMLLGIPVKRIQTIVWVIASILGFAALFLRAGVIGLSLGSALGPTILIRALAACVIGRMENLTMIFFGAVGIGVLEQAIFWDTGQRVLVAPIIFLIILGVLLVQRRGKLARTDEQSHWQAVADVRPIPPELSKLPEVLLLTRGLAAVGVVLALALPFLVSVSNINLAGSILIYAMVAISLVILTGWAGQVSLGQIAFMGFGAAVGGAITTRLGWDISIAILISGLVGAVLAVIIGLPALRLRGLFLAVTTLAFAQASAEYFLSARFDWWLPQGRIDRNDLFGAIPIATERQYYYFVLAVFALVALMARQVRRSRTGRVLIGVRENERGAQSYGINLVRAKLTAFAMSGFIAAVAGSVFVHHQRSLGTQPYAATESLAAFTMVVIGGLGSLPGALVGALYVKGSAAYLPSQLVFFASGLGLLAVLIALPGGLASLVYKGRDGYLKWVAKRHNIMVPSLFADAADLDNITTGAEKGMEFVRQMADLMDAQRAASAAARASRKPGDAAEAMTEVSEQLLPPDDEPADAAGRGGRAR